MLEMQGSRLMNKFWDDTLQYNQEVFAQEILSTGISQFRIIPVEQSISLENQNGIERIKNSILYY